MDCTSHVLCQLKEMLLGDGTPEGRHATAVFPIKGALDVTERSFASEPGSDLLPSVAFVAVILGVTSHYGAFGNTSKVRVRSRH